MVDSVRPHRQQPTRLPIPGTLQARTLEWVAISFSNAWKWKWSCSVVSDWLFATPWIAASQAPPSMGFSRQEYWSGVPSPSPQSFLRPYEKENAGGSLKPWWSEHSYTLARTFFPQFCIIGSYPLSAYYVQRCRQVLFHSSSTTVWWGDNITDFSIFIDGEAEVWQECVACLGHK